MAQLTTSNEYALAIAAVNSYFTNATGNQGNIATTVGDGGTQIRDCGELYTGGDPLTWFATPDASVVPAIGDTGLFAISSDATSATPGADFEIRRNASVIYTNGRVQIALSTNNDSPIANGDARWCIYCPSEDGPVEVYAWEYNTTDPADIMLGNNVSKLLELTSKLPANTQWNGRFGPQGLNGTDTVDLYGQTGIFKKGCIVTWETGNTGQDAVYVAVTP